MKNSIAAFAIRLALALAAVTLGTDAFAQQHPERRNIRAGNKSYEATDYAASEAKYREALEKTPGSYEAAFNLADALYKQERYDEAAQIWTQLSESPALTPQQHAKVLHNLGNTMFAQQKLQESLEYYKSAQRENPDDLETKFNLAYVQKMLQDQNQDQNQDQDQNQNQNQNQQNGNDKDNGDGQNDENRDDDRNDAGQEDNDRNSDSKNDDEQSDRNGDKDQNGNDKPKPDADGQPTPAGISREDAANILDAMQQQEDKTREKVNAQKAATVGRSGKNW